MTARSTSRGQTNQAGDTPRRDEARVRKGERPPIKWTRGKRGFLLSYISLLTHHCIQYSSAWVAKYHDTYTTHTLAPRPCAGTEQSNPQTAEKGPLTPSRGLGRRPTREYPVPPKKGTGRPSRNVFLGQAERKMFSGWGSRGVRGGPSFHRWCSSQRTRSHGCVRRRRQLCLFVPRRDDAADGQAAWAVWYGVERQRPSTRRGRGARRRCHNSRRRARRH